MTFSPRGSALSRSVNGEAADWGLSEVLLASAVNLLAGANWQRGGGKGKRPKPVKPPTERSDGNKLMTLDEMDKFLGYSPRN